MKLFFLLFVVPIAIVAQEIAIEDEAPIFIRPPKPWPPIETTSPVPRIAPKKPVLIVVGGVIRPDRPLNVAIRSFSSSKSLSFAVTLSGQSDNGVPLSIKKYAKINAGNTGAWISFDTSKIASGTYSINVVGEGIAEKRQLVYSSKSSSLMVQIEKAIYAPGQLVQYRVYSIDQNTNAVEPRAKCNVEIRDAYGNLVSSVSNIKFLKGKYENKLQLGDKANFGLWGISVTCGTEYHFSEFEVAEYKLPAFSATLDVPSVNSYSDENVPVVITAEYSFGAGVNGNAKLVVQLYGNEILTRQISIVDGHASVDLSMSELQASSDGWFSYSLFLEVEDSILGQKISSEGYFSVTPYKYYITIDGNPNITPGSSFSYSVKVTNSEGEFPPQGTIVSVQVYIYTQSSTTNFNQQLTLNSAGSASSSFAVPSDANSINLQGSAKESNNGYWWASGQSGASGVINLYPNLKHGESATINKWLGIKAVLNDKVDYFAVFVVSKSMLVDTQRISLKSKSKTATIWINPKVDYYPEFTVFAAYIKNGIDVIIGSVTVSVKDKLNNYVKLSFKEVELKPGANYSFSVESKCDSIVSLSAIDSRVLQLRSGNEILPGTVRDAIQQFVWSDYLPYDWQQGNLPPYDWAFRGQKLYLITNAPPPPQPEYFYDEIRRPSMKGEDGDQMQKNEAAPNNADGGDVQLRKDFRETFYWFDVKTRSSIDSCSSEESDRCLAYASGKVPDSITKYLVYSVSMNEKYGIGVPEYPSNITVKSPFFLYYVPPYFIKRREVYIAEISLFNYITQDQDVVFTISKNGNYDAVDLSNYGWTETATGFEKTLPVKALASLNLQFALTFNSIGIFNIKISARGPLAGDALEKPLRVIPDGIARSITKSVLIVGNNPSSTDLVCEYPDGTYEDTKSALATVIGDLLGKALNNLDNLITMPGGCGEQNLLGLVPNLAIHRHMEATGKLTPAIETRLLESEAVGVQNQLNYRRSDGSFSAFGNSDPSGSVWLTIYTILAFNWASKYVTVDPQVVQGGIDFVISQQNPDGSFNEPGRVIHTDMQGGTNNGLAMTAYISIAINELLGNYPQYSAQRDLANDFLVNALENVTDVYELGILAYALQVANNPNANDAFNQFYQLKIETATEISWQKTSTPPPNSWYPPSSLDVEITSYGLLLVLARNDITAGVKIAKFLTGKTNQNGGFSSSQDTVMALRALGEFATAFTNNGANSDLTLTPDVGNPFNARVDASNALTLQQFQLDSETTTLNVVPSAASKGISIVSLVCNFYQDPKATKPTFNIRSEYFRQCKWSLGLNICSSYIPSGTSNMAIVTVVLPSGFVYQEWWGGPNNPEISKYEVLNSGTKIVFYFNTIGNQETCFDVNAYKAQTLSDLRGGTIVVNDYYDTYKDGSTSYPPPDTTGDCYYGPRKPIRRLPPVEVEEPIVIEDAVEVP